MAEESESSPPTNAADGAIFASVSQSLDPLRLARHGAARVEHVALQWQNALPEQLAGRIAEEIHATTFNIDAASKGLTARAITGAASGNGIAAADITIIDHGRLVGQAQVKYHGTAARTTFHVSRVRYDGMQRVVPSEQAGTVRDVAQRRGVDALGDRNYPAVAKEATDRIRSGGAESDALSRADALKAAANPTEVSTGLLRTQVAKAIRNGALVGAAIGGGVSAIVNAVELARGRKSAPEATFDTLKDTAVCAATGAAVSGVSIAAEAALFRAGASVLGRSAAPVAIGLTVVEVGKDVGRLMQGDISKKELAVKTGKNLVKGGTTWGGMEGGAALGTIICPGIGTVVGGALGGIAGALIGGWVAK